MTLMTGGAPFTSAQNLALPHGANLDGPIRRDGDVGIAVPAILLVDCSWSMEAVLPAAQAALVNFTKRLRSEAVSSSVWLGIITFADQARTVLPMTQIADPSVRLPDLRPTGDGTNFEAAFTESLSQFRADLDRIGTRTDGGKRKVYRPSLYMVTDGEPNTGGDWRVPSRELNTRSWRPNRMTFGMGQANRDIIREISSEGMAYFADDGQTPESMFDAIMQIILRSTVTQAKSAQDPALTGAVPFPVIDPADDPATAGIALLDPINTID